MKLYELRFSKDNKKAWIAAFGLIQALQLYLEHKRIPFASLCKEDRLLIIPRHNWLDINLTFEDDPRSSNMTDIMGQISNPEFIGETIIA